MLDDFLKLVHVAVQTVPAKSHNIPDEATRKSSHLLVVKVFAECVQDVDFYSGLSINRVHCWVSTNVHDHLVHCSIFLWVFVTMQTCPPVYTRQRTGYGRYIRNSVSAHQ